MGNLMMAVVDSCLGNGGSAGLLPRGGLVCFGSERAYGLRWAGLGSNGRRRCLGCYYRAWRALIGMCAGTVIVVVMAIVIVVVLLL
ncbi:hypothetical protein EYC84_007588 [Monilinia fructicola]|uniref:Uncharacterized protein n=1 Tax=Monilinia fructicola TaxID=38448 RepID=A0A5M9JIU1_MONFR|nr:hypothetical protein EYC84_007588 [Monilinia fructicola]